MAKHPPGPPGPLIHDPGFFSKVETPAYLVDLNALDKNLARLQEVQQRASVQILLALKGFAMWSLFDRMKDCLHGVTASSVAEARLGREKWDAQVHAYAPAFADRDLPEYLSLCDHMVFNSPAQWLRARPKILAQAQPPSCGLRVNPEHSEVSTPLYDPCAPGSRLGSTRAQIDAAGEACLKHLEGLHFHTLCELGADALQRTLAAFEVRFADLLPQMKWVNFGGGHHITRQDYDVEALIQLLVDFRSRYPHLQVYLEPGEAVALNTGVLVSEVLDIVENGGVKNAILDCSATAHMPDVLEMPYRPHIIGADEPGVLGHDYRLGGLSCLAGDLVGDYSFSQPLTVGSRLVFLDMAHYTMVKTTTFNGVRLPSIGHYEGEGAPIKIVRRFGYQDYMSRLS